MPTKRTALEVGTTYHTHVETAARLGLPLTDARAWQTLICGSYSRAQVLKAVADPAWQRERKAMLGTTLLQKFMRLAMWRASTDENGDIQVTNYVYALKRGGLIK